MDLVLPLTSTMSVPLRVFTALILLCGLAACDSAGKPAPLTTSSGKKTIGYVLSGFDDLFYSTANAKEECPDGLVHSSKDNWHVQFPTRVARETHFDRCGGVDNRGPNCENVLGAPELVRDPLPYREVKGEKSYGSNLDGTEDGRETATTCAHRQFVHPGGERGIDNQYYRLLGCQKIVHSGGVFAPDAEKEFARLLINNGRSRRILLEIKEVDDERDDEHVEIAIYRGNDSLTLDANGDAVPWQSQRVDEDTPPQYLRGRIVNGELLTEPADVSSTVVSFFAHRPIVVRGAQFRLRLAKDRAEGIRTGYVDAGSWWRVRRATSFAGSFTGDSPPALHEALYRLADGYKDPKTGACTALSSATKFEFVRAFIRHDADKPR